RLQGLRLGACRAGIVNPEGLCSQLELNTSILDVLPAIDRTTSMLHHPFHASSKVSTGIRGLSSQAGTDTSSSEDDDDAFSELEGPVSSDASNVSDPDLSDVEEEDGLGLSDTEADPTEKPLTRKRASSELFDAIMSNQSGSVEAVLNNWVEQGKDLGKSEVNPAMLNLRKRHMYGRALQLSEWLEANNKLDFVERDYASRVDLIAKVRGVEKAETYVENDVPKSFRGEIIYRTLLANCVVASNAKKAEQVFNKMRDLEFELTAFACNQLLLLYKRLDKKKIADVLLLMEKENVKPTLFTYKLLIDTKGQANDMAGMDEIVSTMKAEGIEPDLSTKAVVARHYAFGGLNDKAEAILKEMEGGNLKENRWVCRLLLPIYALLGKADEVGRIWEFCESSPRLEECVQAVDAWGKLKRVKEAESVFDIMEQKWKNKLTSRHYSSLLRVYAHNKMLSKGKDLVRKMGDSGCRVGPLTWDALVKLYVDAGEVEKADAMLHKAVQQNKMKPMFNSYITILDQYSKRGDVHNAEKIFFKMRQSGYVARLRQFQALVQTYVNAKVPAYGMRERMKADNIFPNKTMAAMLAQVDAFRRTTVSDLLD
ncbi:Pentatricopeptide repeat-containing protein At1g80270, mitochondrial, partial [Linum perenne]